MAAWWSVQSAFPHVAIWFPPPNSIFTNERFPGGTLCFPFPSRGFDATGEEARRPWAAETSRVTEWNSRVQWPYSVGRCQDAARNRIRGSTLRKRR